MKKYILTFTLIILSFVVLYNVRFQSDTTEDTTDKTKTTLAQKQSTTKKPGLENSANTPKKTLQKQAIASITKLAKTQKKPGYLSLNHVKYAKVKHLTYAEIKKLPKRDRPDLAALQNFEMTEDPKLGYPPNHRKIAAYNYAKKLLRRKARQKAITGVKWQERGPNNIAGRTRAIMFDPNDATGKKAWAGSVAGGLWVNNDITSPTSSWTAINNFMANLSIGTLAYDPQNKSTFYVGTGPGFTGRFRGAGIWKSTDGGSNWTQLASTKVENFYNVQKIVVTSTSTIMASTGKGLMRSTDGGNSWTSVLSEFSTDVELASNNHLFAATQNGQIYKSIDDGINWTKITPKNGGVRVELAVSPSNPHIVYAVAEGGAGSNDVAWFVKSVNGGDNWKDITIPKYRDPLGNEQNAHFTRGQAFFDLILAVHPTNPNVVFAGGIDVNRSVDGGVTWERITNWVGALADSYAHADQHAMMFRPGFNNELLIGTDGGVFLSQDVTASSPTFFERNRNYNVTTFYSVTMKNEKNSNYIIAGAQDNGSLRTTDLGIGAGYEVTGGDGAYCFIDQNNSDIQITSYVYNSYRLSQDGGKSFKSISDETSKGRFINPTEYDSNTDILYAAGGLNELTRIQNISGTPGNLETLTLSMNNRQITHIKASPYTANRLFVGVRIFDGEGKIYRIDNAHTANPSVTEITGTYAGSHGGWISSIDVGASDNQLLATFSNYGVNSVYETLDGGTNWSNKNGNLPDMPVRWGLYNPNNRAEVLLATEVGVWSADNFTASSPVWEPTNTGLANVRCDMITYRSADGTVAVATFGRGVFTTNIFSTITSADFSTKQTVAYAGMPVEFANNSLNGSTWAWNFGDAQTSTSRNPTHTYATAGTYTVSLSIDGGGGDKTKTKTNYITVLPARNTPYTLANGGNFETNQADFIGKPLLHGVNNWELGTPTGTLNTTASGSNAWKTGLTANVKNEAFSYASALYTPSFNFASTAGAYKLKFKKSIKTKYCNAPIAMQVQYSTDGGKTWDILGSSKPTFGAVNWYNRGTFTGCNINRDIFPSLSQDGWTAATVDGTINEQTEYDVSFLKGNAGVAFRFVVGVSAGSSPEDYEDGFMIDDFEIAFTDPIAEFEANNTVSYVNESVQFNYRSSGATSFSWEFGDGGTAAAENPSHKYTTPGVYNVKLSINGSGGAKTTTKTGYVTVLPSKPSNYGLTDGGNFDVNTQDFAAKNIAGTKFERGKSTVTGKDGTASGESAWVTGLSGNYINDSRAHLYTPLFDFTYLGTYKLEFKAKHKFEDNWDGFIVEYSTDKGQTWFKLNNKQEEGWYNQISHPESIFGIQTPLFSGSTSGEFVTYSTDLSFLGGNADGVAFRFVFLSDAATTDAGVALDDFVMTGPAAGPPVAGFTATNITGCAGQLVTFTNTSTGSITSLTWDFGANASPKTAVGVGPHQVVYLAQSATKNTVKLTANGSIVEQKVDLVSINPKHSPSLSTTVVDQNTVILNASAGDTYQWYKDDVVINGATSQTYTATVRGTYSVAVTIGGCTALSNRIPTSLHSTDFSKSIKAYPVPSLGKITVELNTSDIGNVQVNVTDLSGKMVFQTSFDKKGLTFKESLDLSGLGKGVYLLEIVTPKNKGIRRIVID
ncbi:PKD domain-containing protein [uncultured Microscilla sp.]|uniref:PKD domain-containing protein n=1 Tax=uncultured Microscilla sp. TaxID=432653 RepID=UPI00262F5506|nr:PKD domain-containing protein [uncultured Microscilla sp.]